MPIHDVQCKKCGEIIKNYYSSPWPEKAIHEEDGGELEILWDNPLKRSVVSVHPLERTVIYQDPKTGEIVYPARNDVDMPSRYRQRGFQRVEFEHARDLEKFERENNVANEGYWYNSGNGV